MKVIDILPIAYRNLTRRKTRTFLTSFAVFIGIFLLTVMISLGLGVRTWLLNMITGQMEYTRITVAQEGTMSGGTFSSMGTGQGSLVGEEELNKKVISQTVVDEISKFDHVTQVQPMTMSIPKSAKLEGQEKEITNIMGFGFDVLESDTYIKGVLAGSMHNWYQNKNNVLVSQHFTDTYQVNPQDVIGKKLNIRFAKEGSGGMMFMNNSGGEEIVIEQIIVAVIDVGEDQLNYALPLEKEIEVKVSKKENTTKEDYLENTGYPFLYVNTDDLSNTKEVAKKIKEMDFDAITVEDLIGMINTIFIVIQAVLAIFGLIALFVASIGIINTMIMSIYERTKEIGVMKAIGATNANIRMIFITEAGLIGFLGGVAGAFFGYFSAYGLQVFLNIYLKNIGESSQNFFTFPWELAVGSIFFAVLIGILAGLYPASRASKLDPIEALRYE
ncbi:hypothetical protein A2X44_02620 [candidate division CPR3 bacterium GWF2_35_18]|uniref:Permease n=1 Tax=candidate division CPR3 bacterium GW2011_GWF2_35_18 TaxID=1618350 RepID=A0A0G0BIK6_UNCC3|nr:MAG: Permease [candidate division CPR3 bacterium GW2011_GWF2_35_18]KKP87103.1 MAG: Permease [candidate division CPR3 bacterium GW2011_GWE2_35_7]OGB62486.1 MAG: hypothetical protein A2X44_02620 [candidate division CPR3 bacterium GWF2_35_18]OGB65530.1 MAG: hypothetical protein A2250_04200 [candidate division CPR3 bacterium RIFOXYA2_FULL_35_13]OGB79435.1 MAG: hypothetical protein A2296_03405 [candidate division CPR3 bacterium RIFOXYB2_FULL_35_8]OGB80685.1 MAG: hypothetical protein A2011_02245 